MVLVISVVGMTLLFVALALFYGLLTLLTSMARDRPAESAPLAEASDDAGARLRAAAIAVALARAEAEGPAISSVAGREAGPVSPWWALHHQRQLARRIR